MVIAPGFAAIIQLASSSAPRRQAVLFIAERRDIVLHAAHVLLKNDRVPQRLACSSSTAGTSCAPVNHRRPVQVALYDEWIGKVLRPAQRVARLAAATECRMRSPVRSAIPGSSVLAPGLNASALGKDADSQARSSDSMRM